MVWRVHTVMWRVDGSLLTALDVFSSSVPRGHIHAQRHAIHCLSRTLDGGNAYLAECSDMVYEELGTLTALYRICSLVCGSFMVYSLPLFSRLQRKHRRLADDNNVARGG